MPRPYSSDLRLRVLHALKSRRQKRSEVAAQFQISPATLYLWQKQEKEEGRQQAKPHAGGRACRFHRALLCALVAEQSEGTLLELAALYQQRTGESISISSVDRLLRREGITRKKGR